MLISMDESGTFVSSPVTNSWCVVSAYVFSERMQSRSYATLKKLKKSCRASEHQEIKLKHISEQNYFNFLHDLYRVGGLLFTVATDSHLNTNTTITTHKDIQANKIRKYAPSMKYENGKKAVNDLANEIDALSPQLYVQLQCQVELISDILNRGVLYFVQRDPKTLRKFKWRIDQKNTTRTRYETAFATITSPLLQTKSFREPMIFLKEADYSYMKPFLYTKDTVPDYIENAYGKKLDSGVNIGDIIRKDMKFPNSKTELSIQISDLLASGVRRCLRTGFSNNKLASQLLGRLMLGNLKDKYPIQFVGFGDRETVVDDTIAKIVFGMEKRARGMLL